VHRLAGNFIPVLREEADQLLRQAEQKGGLDWDDFTQCWHNTVRRIIFGDKARDDHELTDMLARLRSDANWSFLKPKRNELRARFLARVRERLNTAEEGSLASIMAKMDKSGDAAPVDQIPQWLFAFDPAGMAVFRTLAVLSAHARQMEQARDEVRNDRTGLQHLPYLRGCMLETLRLWPTTPMNLRETTRAVEWDEGIMPANCGVLIFAPYFHRDERHLSYAQSFEPEHWLDPDADEEWPLVPFSDGPAGCPRKQLVLMLTSAMLARLIDEKQFRLASALTPQAPAWHPEPILNAVHN
jgi:cytochrome P450